jgi:hypothetical protein
LSALRGYGTQRLITPSQSADRRTHELPPLPWFGSPFPHAFQAYLDRDLDHMTCTGGALDADRSGTGMRFVLSHTIWASR